MQLLPRALCPSNNQTIYVCLRRILFFGEVCLGKPNIEDTIDAMIAEQGEVWLDAIPDRSTTWNAVVITDSPRYCYRVMFRDGKWEKLHECLTDSELAAFFAAFGSHWNILLSSWVECGTLNGDSLVPIRAFISNGRKAGSGFSISVSTAEKLKAETA